MCVVQASHALATSAAPQAPHSPLHWVVEQMHRQMPYYVSLAHRWHCFLRAHSAMSHHYCGCHRQSHARGWTTDDAGRAQRPARRLVAAYVACSDLSHRLMRLHVPLSPASCSPHSTYPSPTLGSCQYVDTVPFEHARIPPLDGAQAAVATMGSERSECPRHPRRR